MTNPIFGSTQLNKDKYLKVYQELYAQNLDDSEIARRLGLAVWFMDDGFKTKVGYCLSTNNFSSEDLSTVIEVMLSKFDLHFSVLRSNVLYLTAKDRTKFTNLVEPYIHDDCKYKLHGIP